MACTPCMARSLILLSLKDQELSQTVYHNLRVLLEETDEKKFEHLLKETQKQLSRSPSTSQFYDYFNTYVLYTKKITMGCML